jgi:hypothetical protein
MMLADQAVRLLWHRLLGWPASASGRLCHGDGAHRRPLPEAMVLKETWSNSQIPTPFPHRFPLNSHALTSVEGLVGQDGIGDPGRVAGGRPGLAEIPHRLTVSVEHQRGDSDVAVLDRGPLRPHSGRRHGERRRPAICWGAERPGPRQHSRLGVALPDRRYPADPDRSGVSRPTTRRRSDADSLERA